ncbi:DUF732 domain-containing protein [Mycobacterium sp. M1]|uniref:DUF732 domain-containing protein n=1 Tax=Mycolicibacter acidiphilus TaxID=2835306 RepID=A0ABS5RLY1_9MYCO|nr:DUF732 domain-containing protein [Mycolicibacter acidiphilus]MBS9535295.1 DUF732 domain-containing protein [Mycolicibacter acidiphilus]
MKLRLALLGVCALIGFAAPAHADTGSDAPPDADTVATVANAGFLDSLRAAGITYANPGRVIDAGRAVCGLVNRGEPGLEVVSDIKANNPGFTTDGAAQFAAISARSFCPQQLAKR